MMILKGILVFLCLVSLVCGFPGWGGQQRAGRSAQSKRAGGWTKQNGQASRGKQLASNGNGGQAMMPMNYNFQWNVDDEEYQNYYGHKEGANNGRVDGVYYNLLPDGRLMKVEYYVEGESGFVPVISYEENFTPNWGTSYFRR